MSYTLVGQVGPVTVGGLAKASTPVWGTGANRTAGNLLILWASEQAGISGVTAYYACPTPTGWSKAIQADNGGNQPAGYIFYKIATGGDAAPTLPIQSGISNGQWISQLAEFAGNTAAPLDQAAGSPALGTVGTVFPQSWTVTAPGTDASVNELIVVLNAAPFSGGLGGPPAPALTDSVNNAGPLNYVNNNGVATPLLNRYQFGWGITDANAVPTADSASLTSSTGYGCVGVGSLLVTFKVAPGSINLQPTATVLTQAAALVTTGTLAFVADAQAAAASVNLPSGWQPGDLAVAYAYRNGSNTPPTMPAGWTAINAGNGANTNSRAIGWRALQAGDTSTGTWTNATDVAVTILRNQATVPIGASAAGGANNTTLTMPALTLTKTDGSSWLLLFVGSKSDNANTVTYPNSNDEGSSDGSLNSAFINNATAFAGGTFSAQVDIGGSRTDVIEILAGPPVSGPTPVAVTASAAAVTQASATVTAATASTPVALTPTGAAATQATATPTAPALLLGTASATATSSAAVTAATVPQLTAGAQAQSQAATRVQAAALLTSAAQTTAKATLAILVGTVISVMPAATAVARATAMIATPVSGLVDTFSGSSLDTTKWAAGAGTITVSGGTLNELATTSYPSIWTPVAYRLTGSSMIAQLTPLPVGNGSFQIGMALSVGAFGSESTGGVGFWIGGTTGNLYAEYHDSGGTEHDAAQIGTPPSPCWVRLRESSGTTYWDYSADGLNWTNFYSMADPINTDLVYVSLWAGHYAAETNSMAVFDNINSPPAPATPQPLTASATATGLAAATVRAATVLTASAASAAAATVVATAAVLITAAAQVTGQATAPVVPFVTLTAQAAALASVAGSLIPMQIVLPGADIDATGWAVAPLYPKVSDGSDATVITATLA